MDISTPCDFHDAPMLVFFLCCTQNFCVIATKVQQKFAEVNPPDCSEIDALDHEVVDWYRSVPSAFLNPKTCPERLISAQYMIQNRYFNLRLLLYRPVLLSYATGKVRFSSLPLAEQSAVQKCQDIACCAIDQIASMMHALNKVRVWNASWYLYQASLVVLLNIIIEPDHADMYKWRGRIDKVLEMFDGMSPWSMAASRSKEVVAMIYDACGGTRPANPFDQVNLLPTGAFDASAWDQLAFDTFNEGWGEDMLSWWGEDFSQCTG
jgi:hypothetical protein